MFTQMLRDGPPAPDSLPSDQGWPKSPLRVPRGGITVWLKPHSLRVDVALALASRPLRSISRDAIGDWRGCLPERMDSSAMTMLQHPAKRLPRARLRA